MKHPYADILQAVIEQKLVQRRHGDMRNWVDLSEREVLVEVLNKSYRPESYRIKPATITINSCEVEAPVPTSDWPITVINGSVSTLYAKVYFATKEARDAAYAALIKPFGEQA